MVSIEDLISFRNLMIEKLSNCKLVQSQRNIEDIKEIAFILQIRLIFFSISNLVNEEDSNINKSVTIEKIYTDSHDKGVKWTKFPAQEFLLKNLTAYGFFKDNNSKSINYLIQDFYSRFINDYKDKERIKIITHFNNILSDYILTLRDNSPGTIYTPPIVADFMIKKIFDEFLILKQVNTTNNNSRKNEILGKIDIHSLLSKLKGKRIIDIAVGSGNFIFSIIDYFDKLIIDFSEKISFRSFVQELLSRITVVDIDLLALEVFYTRLSIYSLALQVKYPEKKFDSNIKLDLNVIKGNTLLTVMNRNFDIIIGNPPYYPIRNLNSEAKKNFSTMFESYHANGDIYYLFIEKALKLTKDNNSLVTLIVPRYFTKAPTAKKLNLILENYFLEYVWEFRNLPFTASIHPIIINVKRKKRFNDNRVKTNVKYLTLNNGDLYEEIEDQNIVKGINSGKKEVLNLKIWKDTSKSSKSKHVKLNDICQVSKGVQTGKDGIFVVNEEIISHYFLEKEFLRPWLKGRMIKAYEIIPTEKLFVIHSTQYNVKQIMVAKNIMSYLIKFKEELKKRSRIKDDLWYIWRKGDERITLNWNVPKIITPYKASTNNFALDTKNHYFSQDVVTIIPKKEYQQYTDYLLSLLNSEFVLEFIKSEFKELKQGFFEFYPNQLKKIPIILPDKKRNLAISDMIKKINAVKQENRSIDTIKNNINEILINVYE